MKTSFFKPILAVFKSAGAELTRQNNSHLIFRLPDRSMCSVPRKLDDFLLAKRLAKRAGVKLSL